MLTLRGLASASPTKGGGRRFVDWPHSLAKLLAVARGAVWDRIDCGFVSSIVMVRVDWRNWFPQPVMADFQKLSIFRVLEKT